MIAIVLLAASVFIYASTPLGNTQLTRFDTIIVLGSPTNEDGSISPIERARVAEGVREYHRGVAPALIMTGGAAHNKHIEAESMAAFAVTQRVPLAAIVREDAAHDTIENAYFSVRLMQARGWKSAEVVSSASHLPRASLIFAHFPIDYRMHGAPDTAELGWLYPTAAYVREAEYTDRLRLFGFRRSRYLP